MCKHFTYFPINDNAYHDATTAIMVYGLQKSALDGDNMDGTGIAYIGGDGNFVVSKTGDNALFHTRSSAFYDSLNTVDYRNQPVIGHVRKASFGFKATEKDKRYPDKDAHPFVAEKIILAHNGTITNHTELTKEKGLSADDIDSHMLTQLMSKRDIFNLEDLNAVTSQCQGTFALVMQHAEHPNKLVICRHGKPLFVTTVCTRNGDDVVPSFGLVSTNKEVVAASLVDSNMASRIFRGQVPWAEWSFFNLVEDVWYLVDRDSFAKDLEPEVIGKLEYKKITTTTIVTNTGVHNTAFNTRKWANHNDEVDEAIAMVTCMAKVFKVLPITAEEFRRIYIMLTKSEPDCELKSSQVTVVVEYILYLLENKENYTHLVQFLEANIIPVDDEKFYIERQPVTYGS